MGNLFEVVFQDITKSSVIGLLTRLLSDVERIIGIECTEGVELAEGGSLNSKALEEIINCKCDVCVFFKLQNMKVEGVVLPLIVLRLVKYDSKFDIDFTFDVSSMTNINVALLMRTVHDYVKSIAKNFVVEEFFGGMEPASDEQTRYFTNQIAGPLPSPRRTQ